MPKAYDRRVWRSDIRYDEDNNPHVDELRTIVIRERNVSSGADNRNSILAIIGDLQASTATTAEIAAEPSRVDGSLIVADAPHPDGPLASMGVRVRGYVNARIINQWEAEITVWYSIPYPNNYWGATVTGQPAMVTREQTVWVDIPTIYEVTRPGGGVGREVYGERRVERTTLYVTKSTTVTVGNYGALATYVDDATKLANRIEPSAILGTQDSLKNWIVRGAYLDPDPQTASLSSGLGRWAFVVQYRWTAPIKGIPADGNRVAIPDVPFNGEITVALSASGQPEYKVWTPADNYKLVGAP